MAVASDKAEDVELQPLNQTAEDDQDDVTSPAPKKERKDDPTKSSDFKRMHSYPEDKRAVVKKPKQKAASHSHPELIRRMQSTPALTVCVFLVEKSGRLLNLEDGKLATAGAINRIMMENLSFPPEATKVFSIWLMSPLLQLQLKDHHVPYKLRKVWPELLKKFTNANIEAVEKDEPILCYKRNSFFPLAEEKKITDENMIRRLFEEAKFNVLTGRYPVDNERALKLGGIVALIEHGKFIEKDHHVGFFKGKLGEYLPATLTCKQHWTFRGRQPRNLVEQQLVDSYKEICNTTDLQRAYKLFLKECWQLSFYGSVFFMGQTERPYSMISSILGRSDLPVRVGINRDMIHIIDDHRNEILLSLSFDELSWDYTPAEEHDEDCLDTFWLEFDSKDNGKTKVQRLQIFSKQAIMMDAMVQSCVNCECECCEEESFKGGGPIRIL
ncbi:FERM domain-containing protein 8 isoform X2 [Nematostella vectensis]|uniref:FERM domain-containing protein 8 isoform X2 n=1 Tax=Nematostella vectensis TaxID=45351 RepID=UPI002077700E|nr:FERM domain-containing protein 8 isoform X2 [Nematostella vectensis]